MKHYSLKVSEFKDISKAESKAALKTLSGMLHLFKDGKRWIQEAEEQDGSYCLVGARSAVDGPGENLAQCIMLQALTGEPCRVVARKPVLANLDDSKFVIYEDNSNLLEEAGFDAIHDLEDSSDPIIDFNDDDDREFSEIRHFMKHCIGFAERLVANKSVKS